MKLEMKRKMMPLLLLTVLVYGNSLFSGFVWDDHDLIIGKQDFFSHFGNVASILTSSDASLGKTNPYYRPLNTLTYMLDHYLWGLHPFWYHLENLLLHALAVALFYILLVEIFKDWKIAFFSSLLFALFPLHSEAVDAVFNRNTLLYAIFSLSSLLLLKKGGVKSGLLALLVFFMALLSKELAVTLPFFLLTFTLTTKDEKFKVRKSALACFFAVLGGYFVLRHSVLGVFTSPEGLLFSPERLKFVSSVLFENLKLMFFPFNLNALHPVYELAFNPLKSLFVASVASLLIYLSVAKKSPEPARAGAQWILWGLLPVSNFVEIPSAPVAERYLYLVCFGFVLLLGYLIFWLHKKNSAAGMVSIITLSLVFGAQTFKRNFVWKDDISIFSSIIHSDPRNPKIHYNLATIYEKKGDMEGAEREYKTALDLNPSYTQARIDLGELYEKEGRSPEGRRQYAKAWLNLGLADFENGLLEKATQEFEQARAYDPDNIEVRVDTGVSYAKEGRFKEASKEFEKALKLDPGNVQASEYLKRTADQVRSH